VGEQPRDSRQQYDRALSIALIVAVTGLTGTALHREMRASRTPDGLPSEPPRYVQDWEQLAVAGTRIGRPDAKITIIEFADLECPACRGYQTILEGVQRRHRSEVAIVFMHFPLEYHQMAVPAARALECAAEQYAFDEFLRAIYAKQESLRVRPMRVYGQDAGIPDLDRFETCRADTTAIPAVDAGLAIGKRIPVRFTPTIIVNGWLYPYPPQKIVLEAMIDTLLAGGRPAASTGQEPGRQGSR